MKNLYNLLLSYAQIPYILGGFALFIVFNLILLPIGGEKIKSMAPAALGPLDLEFHFSPDKAYQMIESYGAEGRYIYINSVWLVDTIYPVIYSFTFSLLLILLFKKVFPTYKRWHLLSLLPLSLFFLDVFENIGITIMLLNFPIRMDKIAQMTSLFCSSKWSTVGLVTLITTALLVKLVIKQVRIK